MVNYTYNKINIRGVMDIPAIHIHFNLSKPLTIPVNYHHMIQSFVYSILPEQEATYIHDHGYTYNNRKYKLFTFSNIQSIHSTYDKRTKKITFYDKITISISSVLPKLIENTANHLLML